MKYDGNTENGIPYIIRLYNSNYEYTYCVDSLDKLKKQRDEVLSAGTVTQYTIGNRSISRNQLSASDVLKQWDKLWARKLRLESGTKPRKAVGIVHRDW